MNKTKKLLSALLALALLLTFVPTAALAAPDPIFSTCFGGNGVDAIDAICRDVQGNIYVAGSTASSDLPASGGAQSGFSGGVGSDAFIAKLNPTATRLLACTYLGGLDRDFASSIAVDGYGNVYVAGVTESDSDEGFPATAGAFQTSCNGAQTVFVAKLNSDLSALQYCTYLGGSGLDYLGNMAVDASGNIYVAGSTFSTDFPVTSGAALQGRTDAFVAKISPDGNGLSDLKYSTLIGGSSDDDALAVALGPGGSIYLAGMTVSQNFPTTPGAYQTSLIADSSDAFLAKISPDGAGIVYSTYLGGSRLDYLGNITVDSSGNIYAAGSTASSDFPVTSGATHKGMLDAFVAKISPDGNGRSDLKYSTLIGGLQFDYAYAVTLGPGGSIYLAGETESPNFPTTPGAYQTSLVDSNRKAFLAKISPVGAGIVYSTYLGGMGINICSDMAVDAYGNAYLAGTTYSLNFPTTPGAYKAASGVDYDGFITKLGLGAPLKAQASGGTPQSAKAGEAFALPLEVKITDAGGHPVAGQTVVFTAPAAGASCRLSAAFAVTNIDGKASVTATANDIAGSYTVTAGIEGVGEEQVSFSLNTLQGTGGTVQPEYVIAAAPNSANYGSVTGGGTFKEDARCALAATPKAGYYFKRWTENGNRVSSSYRYGFSVDKARTLTAEFARIGTTSLKAAKGYNQIKLSWKAVSGAYRYEIYCKTPGNKEYRKLATVSGTSYTNANLKFNKLYSYKIRAVCKAGSATTYGPYSRALSARTILATPSNVVIKKAGGHVFQITWPRVPGAQGYQIYRMSKDGQYDQIRYTKNNSFQNTGLTIGRTYYYKVRAWRLDGKKRIYGAFSKAFSMTMK